MPLTAQPYPPADARPSSATGNTPPSGASGNVSPRGGLRSRWRALRTVTPSSSNVLITLAANVLIACSGLITGPIAARLLGPTGRGELAALQNLYWLVGILAMLGLPEAAIYFTARDRTKSRAVLLTGLVLPIAATPFFFACMYFLTPLLLKAQPAEVIHASRWLVLAVPVCTTLSVATAFVRGTNDMVRWNLVRLFPTIGWLALLVGAYLVGVRNPVHLVIGYVVVLAIACIPVGIVCKQMLSGSFSHIKVVAVPMVRYGLPLAGAAVPQILNLRLDQILIGSALPPRELGMYAVAVAWASAVALTPNAVGGVLFPKIASSGVSASHDPTSLALAVRLGTLTACCVGIIVFACTPLALPLLFGSAFLPAVPVAFVLVFAAVVCGVNIIFEETLRGVGDTRGVLFAEACGLIVTVCSLAAMLRPWGIMGAGVASVLGYSGTFCILLVRMRRATGVSLRRFLLPCVTDLRFITVRIQSWRLILLGQNA